MAKEKQNQKYIKNINFPLFFNEAISIRNDNKIKNIYH